MPGVRLIGTMSAVAEPRYVEYAKKKKKCRLKSCTLSMKILYTFGFVLGIFTLFLRKKITKCS